MAHIFISYSRKDSPFVDGLIQALENYGFTTWRDTNAIAGGEVWKGAISRAVRECDAFLVVLSPQSAGSENVSKELAVATKHARHILPVMYQACSIPDKMDYDLAELQWADFVAKPFHEALEGLVHALGGKPTAEIRGTREVQALRDFVMSRASKLMADFTPHEVSSPIQSGNPPSAPVLDFCIHCGARLHTGNAFCTSCGAAIPRV
jgi:hypothetical protein